LPTAFDGFNILPETAEPLGLALEIDQHCLSAELAPISAREGNEVMLWLYNGGRYAKHDVVYEDRNFQDRDCTKKQLVVYNSYGIPLENEI
jgi:hypothetical protein